MHISPSQPEWKPLYEAALFETDETKVPERIARARSAILDRIEDTLKKSIGGEHRAIDDALRQLRQLAEITAAKKDS